MAGGAALRATSEILSVPLATRLVVGASPTHQPCGRTCVPLLFVPIRWCPPHSRESLRGRASVAGSLARRPQGSAPGCRDPKKVGTPSAPFLRPRPHLLSVPSAIPRTRKALGLQAVRSPNGGRCPQLDNTVMTRGPLGSVPPTSALVITLLSAGTPEPSGLRGSLPPRVAVLLPGRPPLTRHKQTCLALGGSGSIRCSWGVVYGWRCGWQSGSARLARG